MQGVVWCRGCSFTFGEGLQYFSNLPSVVIPDKHWFDYNDLTYSQVRFIQNNRYSKLLADKLNTVDVNSSTNGGTNEGIYNSLYTAYANYGGIKYKHNLGYKDEDYLPLEDIGLIVVQFTNIYRDALIFDGKRYPTMNEASSYENWGELFLTDGMTFEIYEKKVATYFGDKFKELFKKIEEIKPDIKIRVFSWENEIYDHLITDPYYKDKLVTFEHNGKTYNTLRNIIYSGAGLTIMDTLKPKCKLDQHMSLEGHKVIAESIFKTL